MDVLLVEDNPTDALLLQRLLGEDDQIHLQPVPTLREALLHLEVHDFAAVILDLNLPDATGLEALDRILARAPSLPVVVLTGGGDPDQPLAALRAGAEDYLLKEHLDREVLLRSLRYAVERRRMRGWLTSCLEELTRARQSECLSLLARGIAHDLNNILTALRISLHLARQHIPEDHPAAEHLRNLTGTLGSVADLGTQLARFPDGNPPVMRVMPLADLIRESASLTHHASNIHYDIAEDLWPGEVDSGQLGRVLANLVLNAAQATPDGGPITVSAHNTCVGKGLGMPEGPYVRIEVKDRGVGIPPEQQQRIFHPLFTTKQDGKGLGLAVCRSIVTAHDGHISVESAPGEGAVFTIHLPAAVAVHPLTSR